jgi:type VII secretion effector (TIGR04197 family)
MIKNNTDVTKSNSEQIQQAVESYTSISLSSPDEKSTITANVNGKKAFDRSQTDADLLTDALSIDAKNIHSIGLAFKEYDALLAIWPKKE